METEAPAAPALITRRPSKWRPGGGAAPREYAALVIAGRRADARTGPARQLRQVEDALHADLGGLDALSTAQVLLCRRAAQLYVEAELALVERVEGREPDMAAHRANVAELRRTLAALGMARAMKETGSRGTEGAGADYAAALAAAEGTERGR